MIRAFLLVLAMTTVACGQQVIVYTDWRWDALQGAWVACNPATVTQCPGGQCQPYQCPPEYWQPARPQYEPQQQAPKYEPRLPDNQRLAPPAAPEPTIDQDALNRWRAEIAAQATAAAKAEVSVLVKQELAAVQPCACAEKWAALVAWQQDISARIERCEKALANPPAQQPFSIRVVDPRGLYSTPYADVYPGQKVDLVLQPLTSHDP